MQFVTDSAMLYVLGLALIQYSDSDTCEETLSAALNVLHLIIHFTSSIAPIADNMKIYKLSFLLSFIS